MSTVDLRAGDATLTVDPDTGRVLGFRVGEFDVLTPGPHRGMFPMAPWCGRMRDGILDWGGTIHEFPRNAEPHAIHGTVRDHPWAVTAHSETTLGLSQRLREPWPWPGSVTHTIDLAPDWASFTLVIEADTEPFPAQIGWHPWFSRHLSADGPGVGLDFHPAWQEERGPDYLPTGNRIPVGPQPWDDAFGVPDGLEATLAWPDALRLTVTSPLEWAVVYTMPPESVCVEPESGPPNGLNTLPRVVEPGSPLRSVMTWRWERPGAV